ncbi:glycoside hydrolase family 5 protein [Moniliophthora roreri]|nr:glycoside hydrolase family 5 protein [Moniliophthora roreri]
MRSFFPSLLTFVTSMLYVVTTSAAPHHALQAVNVTKRAPEWPVHYWESKIRGVNLGGWLLLEAWITPSLFTERNDTRIVDEYTFGQYVDRKTAQSVLHEHWSTFITLQDFEDIKNAGLNHVRIPIGYWAWDVSGGEPYNQGQLFYLNQAVAWARQTGIKVMMDLHGLAGSQNAFDNSGQKGAVNWHKNRDNISRSLAIIRAMATWYSAQTDVVVAIECVNEPWGYAGTDMMNVLRQYYYDSYGNTRWPFGTATQGSIVTVISDAFQSLDSWKGFMTAGFDGVMMDTHIYDIWCPDCPGRSYDEHIASACAYKSSLASSDLWTVVGEWSVSITNCANNGYYPAYGGNTYDGSSGGKKYGDCSAVSGSGAKFTQEFKDFLRKYWEAQTSSKSFDAGVGWIYWTWKTELVDEWSYSKGLEYKWIPQDPTERLYPDICSPKTESY